MTLEERVTYWKRLVKEHRQSHLSVTDFCQDHRINCQRFYIWRKRFQSQSKATITSTFLELVPTSKNGESGIHLRMESGISVELDCNFDPATLRQVISILR
jgi:transposase-like protein